MILGDLLACVPFTEALPHASDTDIYAMIKSQTDCDALEIQLNLAKGNLSPARHDDNEGRQNYRSYAEAAAARMGNLGC